MADLNKNPESTSAESSSKKDIVIVGAGAAGLAAARTIKDRYPESECRVRVLEASEKIGGRMFCEQIDGFHMYSGASAIHESFATVRNMARELGVELYPNPKVKGAQIYAGGKLWGMYVGGSLKQTLTTISTVLRSPQFTLLGIWEFMRLFSLLKKRAKALDFENYDRIMDLDNSQSFADFAREHSLNRYLKLYGELDFNCFIASHSERVGAAYAMALLWLWTVNPASRNYSPKQGISAFVKAVEDTCSKCVHLAKPVERIILEDGVAKGVVTTDGQQISADSVICATTASAASRMLPDLPIQLLETLKRVRYSSCIYVALRLDENILENDSHAALFPPGSPTFLTMVSNLAALAPEAAPPGKSIVHALIIDEHARQFFELSDAQIASRTIQEMQRFFPAMPDVQSMDGGEQEARVYRWPEAMCLLSGGMLREMHDMRVHLERTTSGLFLAGDYTRLPSVNGALKSGIETASASLSYVFGNDT
ncbi:MAG: FAD-dependent oxidoreductase [Gammaproteobacteria bacterium]|nr:FAD-dependent oxidoreductase [Gammaproteobacteria bacterium]